MSRCLSSPPATGVRRRASALLGLLLVLSLAALPGCGRDGEANAGPRLALDAAIPADFPRETRLRIGDPTVQKQLQLLGEIDALPFTAGWQNISGGPHTVEAFRAGALDGGAVGDTPPIHATFTGLDIKIIAVQVREKPVYELATAPGVRLASIQDLRGKKIAYSPGQAQGALVLRALKKAGLSQQDVKLIQISSAEFKEALTSRQVDVAPLSGTVLLRYLNEYRDDGATSIAHGVRDNLSFFYVRTSALEDANTAAALREYVKRRTRAQLWAHANKDAWIEAYYVKDQGLTAAEGRYLIESAGKPQYPSDWTEAIALTQETVDLVAEATGQKRFDARTIFDLRFQTIGAEAARTAENSSATDRPTTAQRSTP
ncbi:ABC transporter [Sorangium cellulosum]|uniref:ABC transporter n=1 Tax=Sorangium cellulosum TaxID=56 RepID=A0A2L0EI74_SORCE|nr:ABC transporter substrate-binding protein [Sorangium cellulosum]AUX39001.1 ABC transporter [Sorangium cellulosum]